jgi:CHRD domain
MDTYRINMKRNSTILVLAIALAGCGTAYSPYRQDVAASLTGIQEVPPVHTLAAGSARITVGPDRMVSGNVTTSGLAGTAAHIHEGAYGENGPAIVPLNKADATTWTVPANTRLTEAQYASYLDKGLYVNVHSNAHPNGEIRAQLGPISPEPAATHSGYY